MGLDMYAFSVERDETRPMVDFEFDAQDTDVQQIHYWRKHPNLHGWMESLYQTRDGKNPDFNCDTVLLTQEDLDGLEDAINFDELPRTSGFFFGETTGEEKEDDLEFIRKARLEIEKGRDVFYYSWW